VEEILPGLVSGVGAGMPMALAWVVSRVDMTGPGTLTVRSF
jgi:hypothetical protein